MTTSALRAGSAMLLVCALYQAAGQQNEPISEAERAALVALFNSTNGPQWKDRTGWLGPRGTECSWFGVECGFVSETDHLRDAVHGLRLADNNLAGPLPSELDRLDLGELWVHGNRLTGPLPRRILEKWEAGQLEFLGYTAQFTSQIQEIVIRRRAAILCHDTDVILRQDGTVTQRSEKCRVAVRNYRADPQSVGDAKPYCEIKTGSVFRPDVDRLAWFLEASGFFDLDPNYARPLTHGERLRWRFCGLVAARECGTTAITARTSCGLLSGRSWVLSRRANGTLHARSAIVLSRDRNIEAYTVAGFRTGFRTLADRRPLAARRGFMNEDARRTTDTRPRP
jgi:hypothetical protein